MQMVSKILGQWCDETELSVNPDKKKTEFKPYTIYGKR